MQITRLKNIKQIHLIIFFLFVCIINTHAQEKKYNIACIGFYNLENLFDTLDQKNIDEEFLPDGLNHYTGTVYLDKLQKLADVVSLIGTDESVDGLALIGCSEIENRSVLEALVSQPKLASRNYKIVHYDSPDERGVDVGLLYNPKYFTPVYSEPLNVNLTGLSASDRPTRDILFVAGELKGEMIYVFVNHWPSRRGGEEATAPLRKKAATVCRAKADSVLRVHPDAKIIIMGDLNDDPTDESVAQVIGARSDQSRAKTTGFYNPWMDYYKEGIGTLAYRDSWNLFDQILISSDWLNKNPGSFFFHKAKIFSRPWMLESKGQYTGYPKRTYSNNKYIGGYSDHLPTYIVFLKEIK